jgi:hypothetical protein
MSYSHAMHITIIAIRITFGWCELPFGLIAILITFGWCELNINGVLGVLGFKSNSYEEGNCLTRVLDTYIGINMGDIYS